MIIITPNNQSNESSNLTNIVRVFQPNGSLVNLRDSVTKDLRFDFHDKKSQVRIIYDATFKFHTDWTNLTTFNSFFGFLSIYIFVCCAYLTNKYCRPSIRRYKASNFSINKLGFWPINKKFKKLQKLNNLFALSCLGPNMNIV